ncbi:MAG TPA: NAD(P)H-binding protein [Chitinophagaceae bacterium]
MSGKIATLAGATGLIGGELLNLLLNDTYYTSVRVLVRRPFAMEHPKLEKKIIDFSDADSLLVALDESEAVFVTIGTTQKKVKGDKEAYRKIDYDIVVNLAKYSKIVGCRKFILVSAVGASSASNNFYLKLKGEVEDAVKEIGIDSTHIMRPSILLGKRNESRSLEKISQSVMKTFSFLLPSRYRPIEASDVAKAMLIAAKKNKKGAFFYEHSEMRKLISLTEVAFL